MPATSRTKPRRITFAHQMKNYIDQTIGFTFFLMLMLAGLSLIPDGFALGDFTLRKMDIFADVRATPPVVETPPAVDTLPVYLPDTLAGIPLDTVPTDTLPIILPRKDSVAFGTSFEDYSFEQNGLSDFFTAVESIKKGKKVRVAWYGDSFVEGDILIGDLRDSLQTLWGGRGVGFLPITSEVAQFKRTIKHYFRNWSTYSIIKKSEARPPLGLNGYAYQPNPGAVLGYEGAQYFRNTRSWTECKLFYKAAAESAFTWRLQDKVAQQGQLTAKGGQLNTWEWQGNYPGTSAIDFQFQTANDLLLYGASLESGPGIYLDNFSVRGNSGGPLKLLRPEFIQQFDAVQQYDLVVLQVGLNAVTNGYDNIRWYQAELERTYAHLRACFPNKPILIVSVGDRGGKIGTELATMRGVPAIVDMQRDLARKHGFIFYDLFRGMGGYGAMIRFSMHRPRLANTDYTHLTHEGGRVVGYILLKHLIEAQQNWRQKQTVTHPNM